MAPFIAHRGRFAAAVDRIVGDRRSVSCRAPCQGWGWRQELADERALLQGRAGERERLGRRRPEQGCRAAVAASSWLAGAVARGSWRVAVIRGARGAALQSGPNPGARRGGSGAAHAKRALWARPEHAHQVLGKMPAWVRERG